MTNNGASFKKLPKRPSLKHKGKSSTRLHSVGFALSGLWYVWQSQRNFQIHSVAALVVVGLGLWVKLNLSEWSIIVALIGLVLCLELVNTSLEIVVDLVTKRLKYRAKLAKDTAAAAVLVGALSASIVGFVIFFDKLFAKW